VNHVCPTHGYDYRQDCATCVVSPLKGQAMILSEITSRLRAHFEHQHNRDAKREAEWLAPVVASLLEQENAAIRAQWSHDCEMARLNGYDDGKAQAEAETQALREALAQVKSERDLLVAMANSLTASSATPQREP
jgi:flagellar biosynthesis/type III secretory pathway protein FliH